MNTISIAGRLTKDAEIRYLNNGDPVCGFSVADDQGKDKKAIFWNASLYGKRAESLAPYLLKGTSVTVSGSVSEREYTDKDGNQRKAMDVRVNDIALQGSKPQADNGQPIPAQRNNAERPAQRQAASKQSSAGSGFDDMESGEIPF